MNSWLLSVCAVVLITSFFSMILPEGKTGKYIKSIFSLFTVLVILSPLIKVDVGSYEVSLNVDNEVYIQQNYLDYVMNKKYQEVTKKVSNIVKKHFDSFDVLLQFDENNQNNIEKIFIIFPNEVINLDKEHIDIIEEIKDEISEEVNINGQYIEIKYE